MIPSTDLFSPDLDFQFRSLGLDDQENPENQLREEEGDQGTHQGQEGSIIGTEGDTSVEVAAVMIEAVHTLSTCPSTQRKTGCENEIENIPLDFQSMASASTHMVGLRLGKSRQERKPMSVESRKGRRGWMDGWVDGWGSLQCFVKRYCTAPQIPQFPTGAVVVLASRETSK